MRCKNKSGQFYLIAAIVIISLVIGFTGIANYSKKTNSERINGIRDEMQIETAKIVEYGVENYNYIERLAKINELLKNVSEIYSNYSGVEEFYYVLGDTSSVAISAYMKDFPETANIDGTETIWDKSLGDNYKIIYHTPTSSTLTIKMNNIDYAFELTSGLNLYFIISKGDYVATNKNF